MSAENASNRFILVWRKTRLQELVERFNTWPQARFYLHHNQVDSEDFLVEHDRYQHSLQRAHAILAEFGWIQKLSRDLLPSYQFAAEDIVVVVGQDGLVANCLKYLPVQPVIAINPDPKRWDGHLLPFEIDNLRSVVRDTLAGRSATKTITLAEARSGDGQCMLAVNDLFIGPKSHTSARYELSWDGGCEAQSSSGVIVSTGLGSSGWFQSILTGAMAVANTTKHQLSEGFAWDSPRLQFTVREPFLSKYSQASRVFGEVTVDKPLLLTSMMPENGVIFSDGVEADYMAFNAGAKVEIGVSAQRGRLVV